MPITSQDIYNGLKKEILDLTLKPGEKISENSICERFGVSRTPVRTAFQRLENIGLIEVIPYKGTSVSLLNYDEISQIIYMRIAIESMVLRDFIDIMDSYDLEKIRHIIKQQNILLSLDSLDTNLFYTLDSSLHKIWFTKTKKLSLWEIMQNHQINYTRFRMLDLVGTAQLSEIYSEHILLFEAIKNGDSVLAASIITNHLNGGFNRLESKMKNEFSMYFKEPKEEEEEAII